MSNLLNELRTERSQELSKKKKDRNTSRLLKINEEINSLKSNINTAMKATRKSRTHVSIEDNNTQVKANNEAKAAHPHMQKRSSYVPKWNKSK